MKAVIVFVCLFAVALAAPANDVQIVKQESNVGPDSYSYVVETSDGVHHDESGHLINAGSENAAIVVQGSYAYKDANGHETGVSYTADEFGYHPKVQI